MRLSATRLTCMAQAGGGKTWVQRAIAVLRRFGPNAHAYIPGIGMLNGLQAANYIDSTGRQEALIDQPAGFVKDGMGVLGVELSLPTTSTAGWVANEATLSVDAGRIKCITAGTGDNGTYEDFSVTAGKTYAIVATLTNAAATSNAGLRAVTEAWTPLGLSNAVSAGATGEVRVVVTATTATLRVAFDRRATGTSGDVIYVASASVREISGIHATQTLTGSKPILRKDAGGHYFWQFDGSNDSLQLGGPLFQVADDHCVVAGVNSGGNPAFTRSIFTQSSSASDSLPRLALTAGSKIQYYAAGGGVAIYPETNCDGSVPNVVSARKVANFVALRVNAVSGGGGSLSGTYTLATSAAIGSNSRPSPSEYYQGAIYPVIAVKGTVSDADLLLLEKLVANMSGVQL